MRDHMLFVEAEAFADHGGWSFDTQFVEAMGSAYLLAHGLGAPVADAVTRVVLPAAGAYHVYVRTRDWASPRGLGHFRLLIDGKPLRTLFGTDGNGAWHWQDGGLVQTRAQATLALRDETGFDARCDAVLFVNASLAGFVPPEDRRQMDLLRRSSLAAFDQPDNGGNFDFVVAGGGFAGVAAAVTAARHGLRVALIQDRPVLGGPASNEVRVQPIHRLDASLYPRNSDVVREMLYRKRARAYVDLAPADELRRKLVESEPNISLFLNTRAAGVERSGDRLSAVITQDLRTGRRLRLNAPLFADCTGDSVVGRLAGAEHRIGRESRSEFGEPFAPEQADRQLLGNSIYWYATDEQAESGFRSVPWALPIESDAHFQVPAPKWPQPPADGVAFAGGWNWESGFLLDNILQGEHIRDHLLRAIYGTWDYLKNKSPQKARYAKTRLAWAGYILGKRESYRLMGDFLLSQNHIAQHDVQPDGCCLATWYFDLHYPHPENTKHFPGQEFRSVAYDDPQWQRYAHVAPGRYLEIEPYPIPYRCFYSRNIPNLFMAGRNISVTHVGLAPVRTMMCTGQMGVVVGRAAYLCRKLECAPRAIYERHLDAFKQLLADPGIPERPADVVYENQ